MNINESFDGINQEDIEKSVNKEVSINFKPWFGIFLIFVIAAVMAITINYSVLNEYGKTIKDSVISKYSVATTINDLEFIIDNNELSDSDKVEQIKSTIEDFKSELKDDSDEEIK